MTSKIVFFGYISFLRENVDAALEIMAKYQCRTDMNGTCNKVIYVKYKYKLHLESRCRLNVE